MTDGESVETHYKPLCEHLNERDRRLFAANEAKSAPVLRAVNVEFFSMINPRPHPDPHAPRFPHGEPRVEPAVSIVQRADLPDELDARAASGDLMLR